MAERTVVRSGRSPNHRCASSAKKGAKACSASICSRSEFLNAISLSGHAARVGPLGPEKVQSEGFGFCFKNCLRPHPNDTAIRSFHLPQRKSITSTKSRRLRRIVRPGASNPRGTNAGAAYCTINRRTSFHRSMPSEDGSLRQQSQAVSGIAEASEASPPRPSGESADRQPLRGGPRGGSIASRCPKPTRRNAGLANGPPKKMQGQLRWRWSGGILGGMDSSVRWGR
jgi:hypothetical protein